MNHANPLRWDMESIFPGGSDSAEFVEFLTNLEKDVLELQQRLAAVPAPKSASEGGGLADAVEALQSASKKYRQAVAFTSCLVSQDVADKKAQAHRSRARRLGAELKKAWTLADERFLEIDDDLWRALLADERFSSIKEALDEQRRFAQRRLSPDREALVSDLAVDGYHAWGELYNTVSGAIRVPYREDGNEVSLSVGQAQNKVSALSDPDERAELFAAFEEAWAEHSDVLAAALNHLAGFRLTTYRHRGWTSILEEPLEYNRMSQQTLNAMWEAIEEASDLLTAYLQRRAERMGLDRLRFCDLDAGLGQSSRKLPYSEATDMIVEHFSAVSKQLGAFARRAVDGRWIEAEDRPGKRAGGFCTWLPESGVSRIFLTYDGSLSRATTIAHELGHAFHHTAFDGAPYLMTGYPMTLAETASTLAEQILADALLANAADDDEALLLLDAQAQRCVTFFMNIRARFLFELDFYQEREKGAVPADALNALMEQAQRRAYQDSLAAYHPIFWASKLHFYLTSSPFYNFPYTFGFLLSQGIYQWALADPKAFEARYVQLLRDTGWMSVEALAKEHFGADLTAPDFWRDAVERAVAPVRAFLKKTDPS